MEETNNWVCMNCKYKFVRKRAWKERLCPYCGKEGYLKLNAIQKMIDEVPRD